MSDLLDFVKNTMNMSGPYQPVVIMTLLDNGGNASLQLIAADIALHTGQTIDYVKRLKIYPKQVLSKHGICSMTKLNGISYFTLNNIVDANEIEEIKKICLYKLNNYLDA